MAAIRRGILHASTSSRTTPNLHGSAVDLLGGAVKLLGADLTENRGLGAELFLPGRGVREGEDEIVGLGVVVEAAGLGADELGHAAVGIEFLGRNFKLEQQVEQYLDLPVFAVIPDISEIVESPRS